jgi:RimJ/RimL family protein N-acetyltransferase
MAGMELRTERLLLRPMPLDEARAVDRGDRDGRSWSSGYPADGDVVIARVVIRNPPRNDLETLFGTRQIVDRRTGLVIGALGFYGPPDEKGTVELGYGVVPEARGRASPPRPSPP